MLSEQAKHPKNPEGAVHSVRPGRPRTVSRKVTLGLPDDVIKIYDSYIHKVAFVADAIRHYHRYLEEQGDSE